MMFKDVDAPLALKRIATSKGFIGDTPVGPSRNRSRSFVEVSPVNSTTSSDSGSSTSVPMGDCHPAARAVDAHQASPPVPGRLGIEDDIFSHSPGIIVVLFAPTWLSARQVWRSIIGRIVRSLG